MQGNIWFPCPGKINLMRENWGEDKKYSKEQKTNPLKQPWAKYHRDMLGITLYVSASVRTVSCLSLRIWYQLWKALTITISHFNFLMNATIFLFFYNQNCINKKYKKYLKPHNTKIIPYILMVHNKGLALQSDYKWV
jgi:hypothetical protein